jgi:glycosyltransferase involved in cell wall biosynthesis
MHVSVIVPAHNEELLLPRGLEAIHRAARGSSIDLEVVVVANRCTDATAAIAESAGAVVVENGARNIATVRNAGVSAAGGDVIVTIDADSRMAPNTFSEIERHLASGHSVGGGASFVPERSSAGIQATVLLTKIVTRMARVSGVMFWCGRSDFDAIGGFNEDLVLGEDVDFARRLRLHGRRTGRRFTTLRAAPVVISTRKFDRFGDWHMFAMAAQLREIRAAIKGTDTAWVDRYFFDYND